MRRTSTLLLAATALPLTLLPLAGCQHTDRSVSGPVRIATGSPTAVYYRYGLALHDLIHTMLPRTQPAVLTTAASAENIAMVENGTAQLGFTQADIAATVTPGAIMALARLYDDCLHLVVRADGDIWSLADLKQHRVSIGEAGSGTQFTADRLLMIGGIDPEGDISRQRLGLDDSAAALLDRKVDAFFFSGGLPVAAVAKLARTTSIRLIDLRDYVAPLRRAYGAHYTERVVPQSTYGIAPVVSIGIPNYLVVSPSMSAELAYALTMVLFSGREQLARAHPVGASLNYRNAISTPPLLLHPGAERYYRSVKT